jgi:hypothetical protein
MSLRAPILAFALLCATAPAQEADPTEAEAAPAQEAVQPTVPVEKAAAPADDEPLTAPPPAAKATGPSPDSFKPSEEISEDLSVSFPVDI